MTRLQDLSKVKVDATRRSKSGDVMGQGKSLHGYGNQSGIHLIPGSDFKELHQKCRILRVGSIRISFWYRQSISFVNSVLQVSEVLEIHYVGTSGKRLRYLMRNKLALDDWEVKRDG